MKRDLIQLVYVSSIWGAVTEDILNSIQLTAVRHNSAHDITGVLLYRSGHFLQLLEGPAEHVDALYESILGDTRHREIQMLVRRPAAARSAEAWSMGVLNLDNAESGFEKVFDKVHEYGNISHTTPDENDATDLINQMTACFAGYSAAA